jgi:hypothetical protein
MKPIFAFIAVFALLSALPAVNVSAAQPMFSADVDTFLGQKSRRNSGGRVWSNFYYGGSTLEPEEGWEIKPQFCGAQLGFDVKSHDVYSTYFLNVNQSKTNFGGEVTSKIDNYLLGYGQFFYLNGCHYGLTASAGYDRYELAFGETGLGDGLQANLFGEFGFDFIFGRWAVKPFYALQYDFLWHSKIRRTTLVLLDDWSGHGLNQLVGLRLNWKIFDRLELQSRSVWIREMLKDLPPFYRARFSPVHGTHTAAMMFYEGNMGRDLVWLGFGGKFECTHEIYLYCDYDLLLNERHTTHTGSLGLRLGW